MILLMVLMLSTGFWQLDWLPDAENLGIWISYECPATKQHPQFFAKNWFGIEPAASSGRFHKISVNQPCWLTFEVMRGHDGPLTPVDEMWAAESAVLQVEE